MPRTRNILPPLRSSCPISGCLDLVGDKWTLLVVRDLLMGKSRYGDFAASPEGIPSNLLADRLSRLEAAGIVTRKPYQKKPIRYAYALTRKGEELSGVLAALGRWGQRHIPATKIPEIMGLALGAKSPPREG